MKKSSLLIFTLSALATQAQINSSSFSTNASFPAVMAPIGIDHADFDGDGKEDIVVTNFYDNAHNHGNVVSVYKNQRTAGVLDGNTYAPKIDFTVAGSPQEVAAHDMDGDGKADLVVADYVNPGYISVLRNTTTTGSLDANSFAPKIDFPVEPNPSSIAIGDLDGDGKPDMVSTSTGTNIQRNTSTVGALSFDPAIKLFSGINTQNPGATNVQLGDLDGDGKLDIVVVNLYDNVMSVYRNISNPGTIAFEERVNYETDAEPDDVAIADLDGDGKNDVVVVHRGSELTYLYRNLGTSGSFTAASFAAPKGIPAEAPVIPLSLQILIWMEKKKLRLVDKILVFQFIKTIQQSDPFLFADEVNYQYPYAGTTGGLIALDYDGDGRPDLAGTNYDNSNGRFSVLRNETAPVVLPDFDFNFVNLICPGATDGSITLHATAGTGPFQYSINGGASFQSDFQFNGLATGTYQVVVKNTAGTSAIKAITLIQKDTILPVITGPADITVTANGCDAVVNYTAPVGTDNCTGAITKLKKGLASGSVFPIGTTKIEYEVKDASGNKASYSFKVIVKSGLTGSISAATYSGGYAISCNGKSDGQATAVASNGCAPYTFEWSTTPVQTSATATNLSAGNYKVKITDANANSINVTVKLTQPPVLSVKTGDNATVYYGYAPQACTVLEAKVKGGAPAYTYLWSNGSTAAAPTVCPTAYTDYSVTVKDANGCTAVSNPVSVCVVDVHCGNNGNVSICHKTVVCSSTGKTKNETLCVLASEVAGHLAHGDKLGACGTAANCKSGYGAAAQEDIENVVDGPTAIVYPNPSSSRAMLEFRADASERTVVQVYNMQGVLVANVFDATTEEGEVYQATIDGTQWAKGLYLIKIVSVTGVQNLKLVISE